MPPADEPIPLIACPSCGTLFKWKAGLAGRKLKCHCGALMRMPLDPSGEATPERATAPVQDEAGVSSTNETDHDPYELELPESEKNQPASAPAPAPTIKHTGHCPTCGAPIKPQAIVCVNCGLNLAEGKNIQTQVGIELDTPEAPETPATPPEALDTPHIPTRATQTETARLTHMVAQVVRERKRLDEQNLEAKRQHRFQELYLPLILLAGGVVAVIIGGVKFAHSWPEGLLIAAGLMAIEVFVMMPLLLLSVFIAARVGGIGFGSLPTAVLKLAAICIGPGTVADLLMIVIMAIIAFSMAGFFVVFAVYLLFLGLPMARLFDLDMHETSLTVAIAIIVRAVALVLGYSLLAGLVHP